MLLKLLYYQLKMKTFSILIEGFLSKQVTEKLLDSFIFSRLVEHKNWMLSLRYGSFSGYRLEPEDLGSLEGWYNKRSLIYSGARPE